MPDHVAFTNEASGFLDRIRSTEAGPGAFGHENHIRLAFIHLRALPFDEAIVAFTTDLRNVIERLNAHDKYHETITMAYLLAVMNRIQTGEPSIGWERFKSLNGDLFDRSLALLERWYSDERLMLEAARHTFLKPDREPFPVRVGRLAESWYGTQPSSG